MKGLTAFAFVMLLASTGQAQVAGPRSHIYNGGEYIVKGRLKGDGFALNASEDSRTVIAKTLGYSQLVVAVNYTHGTATDVRMQFWCSMDDGLTFHRTQTRSIASGKATLSDLTDVKAVTGNAAWMQEYDMVACNQVKLIFSGTNAGANDKVAVQLAATSR